MSGRMTRRRHSFHATLALDLICISAFSLAFVGALGAWMLG